MKKYVFIAFSLLFLMGCAPEVGSEQWCDELNETPKGEWTVNQAKDYGKHCIFR